MNDATAQGVTTSILSARALRKQFRQGDVTLNVLNGVNLEIGRGERVAIIGVSGSGKTTLLQLLGGLDLPTGGSVSIQGLEMSSLSDAERGELRNRAVGFVYQFHHLLPEFTALENVAMPLLVRRMRAIEAREAAARLLERVGLSERLRHRPAQLSGGERQRAAVARALVTRPALVLADEPTGNLDGQNAAAVFALMLELNRELGTSLVVVTHDPRLAARMDRVLSLEGGILVDRGRLPS
jgi:lipoprotein-releasing system ATP-binding protein